MDDEPDPIAEFAPARKERSHLCDSHGEEMASVITHGIGAVLAVAALVVLLVFSALHGTVWDVVASCLFGGSMIVVFVISAVYHVVTDPRAKEVMQIVDRSSIYLLIAGSYAPLTLGVLRGPWGWSLFGIVWTLAITGITLTIVRFEQFRKIGVVLYVVMGWLVVVVFFKLLALLPVIAIVFLVAGGVSYTFGLVFFAWEKLKFNHSLWHLFVVGGGLCHFFAFMWALPL